MEIDNFMIANKIDFCRFVDDYRIFASDAQKAHSQLAMLVQRLSKEGITLNSQKTKLTDISSWKAEKNKSIVDNDSDKTNIASEACEKNTKHFVDENKSKIIRGYSGLVPTKFRELTLSQIEKLQEKSLDEMYNVLKETILVDPKSISEFIKTIVAQNRIDYLAKVPELLKKFPQFIPYFIDVIIKKGKKLDESSKQSIKYDFMSWFNEDTPEYIQVYIVRLLSSEIINDKECLLNLFRELKRNSGEYIGRALLEALDGKLNRGEAIELRDYFYRADNWERRQILKLVQQTIPKSECRPFMKDIAIYTDDIFLNYMKKTYNKTR